MKSNIYTSEFIIPQEQIDASDYSERVAWQKEDSGRNLGYIIQKDKPWVEERALMGGKKFTLEVVVVTRDEIDNAMESARQWGYKQGMKDAAKNGKKKA